MSKQTINIGQTPNDRTGDPLRTAFEKINANFTELYANDAADFDGNYNSLTNKPTIPTLSAVDQHIIPDTDVTYDLGSPTNRFRTLYLSGNTIDLGGALISTTDDGNISIPGLSEAKFKPGSIDDYRQVGEAFFNGTAIPEDSVIIDQATWAWATSGGNQLGGTFQPSVYSATFNGSGFITAISIVEANYYDDTNSWVTVNTDNMYVVPAGTLLTAESIDAFAQSSSPIEVLNAGVISTSESIVNIPSLTIPADVSDLTDTTNLLFDGSYNSLTDTPTIPTDIGDLTDTGGILDPVAVSSISNGTTRINIPAENGNIEIDGNVELYGGLDIHSAGAPLGRNDIVFFNSGIELGRITTQGETGGAIQIQADAIFEVKVSQDDGQGGVDSALWEFDANGGLTLPTGVTNNGRIINDNGISLKVDSSYWTFDTDGILNGPGGILSLPANGKIASGNGAQIGYQAVFTQDIYGNTTTGEVGGVTYIDVGTNAQLLALIDPTSEFGNNQYNLFSNITITYSDNTTQTFSSVRITNVSGSVIGFGYDDTTAGHSFPITLETANYAPAYTAPEWEFGADGSLTFPDATVQSTAYPGPQNTLDGDSISIGRVDAGEVDIYGDVEFNNGTTAFQAGNSVSFNGPVNFASATVTGLQSIVQSQIVGVNNFSTTISQDQWYTKFAKVDVVGDAFGGTSTDTYEIRLGNNRLQFENVVAGTDAYVQNSTPSGSLYINAGAGTVVTGGMGGDLYLSGGERTFGSAIGGNVFVNSNGGDIFIGQLANTAEIRIGGGPDYAGQNPTTFYGNVALASGKSLTFGDASTQTTAWTGSVAYNDVPVEYLRLPEPDTLVVTPTPTSAGTKGQVIYSAGYVYICVATNTWVRASAETTWE